MSKRIILTILKYLITLLIIFISYFLSYYIRFEGQILNSEFILFKNTSILFLLCFILSDILFGIERSTFRYTSLRDIQRVGFFALTGNIFAFIFVNLLNINIPRSIFIINFLILFILISGIRLFYRITWDKFFRLLKKRENVLIIGDGDSAASLQYSILKDHFHQFRIVGFISLDKKRVGDMINAIPIIGDITTLEYFVKKKNIKYVFIALDRASNQDMKNIIKTLYNLKIETRIVPSMFELIDKNIALKDLREIRFEDYLGREPVNFDIDKIKNMFFRKNILITGAGGSIGSGIARKLIRFKPNKLLLLDISENNLFKLSMQLNEINSNQIDLIYKVMDIRNSIYLEKLLKENSIDYFIHTAALKHVPFCEDNVREAISINVYGTLVCLDLAKKYNVEKFVYISTDKAVEPESIMGATKRIGELLVSFFGQKDNKTKFMIVRFGNVIGSSGNVIEIFSYQLQNKRPITITDKNMARFFMSLDEAINLILESISIGENKDLFILDMGRPIKIKDLASDMALFYGRNLKDSDFVYIGKRKGEKLEEKLFNKDEVLIKTDLDKIFRTKISAKENLLDDVYNLMENIYKYSEEELKEKLFFIIR